MKAYRIHLLNWPSTFLFFDILASGDSELEDTQPSKKLRFFLRVEVQPSKNGWLVVFLVDPTCGVSKIKAKMEVSEAFL